MSDAIGIGRDDGRNRRSCRYVRRADFDLFDLGQRDPFFVHPNDGISFLPLRPGLLRRLRRDQTRHFAQRRRSRSQAANAPAATTVARPSNNMDFREYIGRFPVSGSARSL